MRWRARARPTEASLPQPIQAALKEVREHMAAADTSRRLPDIDEPRYVDTMMTCPDFIPLLERMTIPGHLERERMWLQESPHVAQACACEGVEVEHLTAMTWDRIRPDRPALATLALHYTLASDAAGDVLPATARGVDLVRAIEQHGARPVRLTRPPRPNAGER